MTTSNGSSASRFRTVFPRRRRTRCGARSRSSAAAAGRHRLEILSLQTSNHSVTWLSVRAKPQRLTRDPDRTRGCILNAAIAEFSAKGLAGARVDAIARRAGTNKRMLYHYFTDKEGLFRAVLRWKIAERRVLADSISGEPTKNLPLGFQATCQEADWVRLLGWESLQNTGEQMVGEAAPSPLPDRSPET